LSHYNTNLKEKPIKRKQSNPYDNVPKVEQTMGNQSVGSLSQGKSLKSSTGSNVFKSNKPPTKPVEKDK